MITNKDVRVEGRDIIINGEKHPLDPAVDALIKRANTVQGKFSALDTKLDAIEALEKSANGNPISLTGAAAAYAIGLSMTIEPIQSGSGDPSPENVRPISGLTEATVQTTNGTDTNTATITFGQTVYGGSVDFKTGKVTVTHGMVDLGTLDWSAYSQSTRVGIFHTVSISDIKTVLNTATDVPDVISDIYTYRPTSALDQLPNFCMRFDSANFNRLAFKNTNYTDAATFKTAMSGVQLCYELATLTTLTLTPAELELLKGGNTISGNGVTINLDYIGR